MNKRILIAGLLTTISLLIFLSCGSNKDKSVNPEFGKYISAFTSGNIHNSSVIEIQLTQDIHNVEIGATLDKSLFSFSPSVKGEAHWKNSNTVVFVPEKGELKPGKEYEAHFKIGKVMKVDEKFEDFTFFFNVPEQNFQLTLDPYAPIQDTNLAWNAVSGVLQLSNDAELEDIQNMFTISGKETKKARVKITPTQNLGYYNVVIDSLFRSETETMTYTIKAEAKKIGGKKVEEFIITIPAMPEFDVLDAEIVYEPQECIRITFSDPLSQKQNIQGLVSINSNNKNYSFEIEKNSLKLYVDAEADEKIELKIFKEIKNSMNKPLGKNKTYSLTFEKHDPQIKLISQGNILPDANKLIVPFQAVNLWAVDVRVVKVFENNILHYLQTNDFGENSELKRFGKLIMKKRIRLDKDPSMKLGRWNTFSLDLSELIEKDPGAIYKVEFQMKKEYSTYPSCGDAASVNRDAVPFDGKISEREMEYWESPDYYYYSDVDWSEYNWQEREDPCTPSYYINKSVECFALSSNIGITAKQGAAKNVFVALNNIVTTEPISGADVEIYNYQMQVIGSGKTDGDGFAMIDYKGGVPFAILAKNGKDKGYLKISSNLSLSLSNFDVSGRELKKGLKGYIYGERGVWRPGDSIYVTFILEDREKLIPKEHPATLDLFTPKGQLYKTYVSSGSQNGFYSFRMATTEDAITGGWMANVKIGGAEFSQRMRIETVKPNRLKVRLKTGDLVEASDGRFNGSISAQWLHGAPASRLDAKVEMTLSKADIPFEGYEGYVFNNPATTFTGDTYELYEGTLDSDGNANVNARLPQAENAPGMLRANFISRVFETGGDASIYTQVVPYSPYSSYVGIKVPKPSSGRWLETDATYALDIATVKPNGKPVDKRNLNVKIYKIGWSWWWNSSRNDFSSYVNSTSAEIVLNKTFSTQAGKAKVDFKIEHPNWGRYLVMVTDKDSGHSTGDVIYVDWPSYRGRSDKTDAQGLTMLSFSTDKEKYEVGEDVTVILPKSSDGRALISVEDGSRIISKSWVKTSATEDTKHIFKVTQEMAPNFYIFASLFQPHGQANNDLPVRMYGVLNIQAENKETILKPIIKMADDLRPETNYEIEVTEANKKGMTYTLAVVDEGLLDLTAFKTPNAWDDFYARQALGVRTWDMYDYIVGAQTGKMGPLLSIGGDEALKAQDETMKRFKPVVTYIGPFTLEGGKTNKHKMKMPAYYGSVRVMVVAGNQQGAYGNAQKAVPVRNPLMVISTLPRVAGPGEEILLPVNVFAMDKKVKDVIVKVKSSGLFEFTDGDTQSVSFSDVGDKTIFFKVKVSNKVGFEKVDIIATGGGETSTESINIEIRNPNPPTTFMQDALVEKGQASELSIGIESPMPKDWVKLEVSRMPGLDLNRSLKYLFQYPHGCSEQVTSKAFPALYVHKFRDFTASEKETMKSNVRSAIGTITARQLANGGIAYWPDDRYPNEWVSTYATHFLVEAEREGYNVASSVKNKALDNLKKGAQQWNRKSLYNSYYSHSMSDLQQAYRLYVLALANQPELGAMNRLKEMADLEVQARWRLAAAYALAGRKDAASEIISKTSTNVSPYSFSNDTYGSYGRDLAMIIETQVLMGNTKEAVTLAQKLSKEVSSSSYLTTQTSAYSLIALGKLADKLGTGAIMYEWELNGKKQKSDKTNKVYHEVNIDPQETVNVKFQNTGEGTIYVRLVGMTQPMEDKQPAQNKGVNLAVRYVNTNGSPIDVAQLKQGTEFYAVVTAQNISGRFMSDLTLTQIFPSGWEIFNTRLFNEGSNANSGSYNYQDIRDDRVYTYFNLGNSRTSTFRIKLQAAYRGKYFLPAVTCEAMYNPEEQSRTTGQWVEVVK